MYRSKTHAIAYSSSAVLVALGLCSGPASATEARHSAWGVLSTGPAGPLVSYPADVFVSAMPTARATGRQTTRSKNGRAELTLYSSVRGTRTPEQAARAVVPPELAQDYFRATNKFYAYSGTLGADVIYVRCNAAGPRFVCFEMRYPAAEQRQWDSIVTRVSLSLRAAPADTVAAAPVERIVPPPRAPVPAIAPPSKAAAVTPPQKQAANVAPSAVPRTPVAPTSPAAGPSASAMTAITPTPTPQKRMLSLDGKVLASRLAAALPESDPDARFMAVPIVPCTLSTPGGPDLKPTVAPLGKAKVPVALRDSVALYQASEAESVLAPKDWQCRKFNFDTGSMLLVAPVAEGVAFAAGYKGPLISVLFANGGSSGRTTVGRLAASVFPSVEPFVKRVQASPVSRSPDETLSFLSDTAVVSNTPANTPGLGTFDFGPTGEAVTGLLYLTGTADEPSALFVRARLAGGSGQLSAAVLAHALLQ